MSNPIYTMKRGDTFAADFTYTPATGWPADLSALTAASQVRHNGALVATLEVTKTADNLGLRLRHAAGTASWPYGALDCDIRFQQTDGTKFSSKTFTVSVLREVTQ